MVVFLEASIEPHLDRKGGLDGLWYCRIDAGIEVLEEVWGALNVK